MNQEIQYKKGFSLFASYKYLENNGLKEESDEIRSAPDRFKSYTSTLRRAKVISYSIDFLCQVEWLIRIINVSPNGSYPFYEYEIKSSSILERGSLLPRQ